MGVPFVQGILAARFDFVFCVASLGEIVGQLHIRKKNTPRIGSSGSTTGPQNS